MSTELKTIKDFIRKYCFRISRKKIESMIKNHELYPQLDDAAQFTIMVAMNGYTNFYKTHDLAYLKRVYVYFKLFTEAKDDPNNEEFFNKFKTFFEIKFKN